MEVERLLLFLGGFFFLPLTCRCNYVSNNSKIHQLMEYINHTIVERVVMKANPMFEELRYLVKSNEVRETGRKLNEKQEELRSQLEAELEKLDRNPRWTASNTRFSYNYSPIGPVNGASQIQYLLQRFQQAVSQSRDNSVSIDNLLRWKSSTQFRIERLEHLLRNSAPNPPGHVGSRHGWNDWLHQQEVVEENSRQIETMRNDVVELQGVVRVITEGGWRHYVKQGGRANNTAPVAQQRYDVDANTRKITSLKTSLEDLERQMQALQSSSESSEVTVPLRQHEARLAVHDVMLRNQTAELSSLQQQLFRAIRRGRQQDATIRFLRQRILNSSFNKPPESGNSLPETGNLTKSAIPRFSELIRMVGTHHEKIKDLHNKLANSCCQRFTTFARKVERNQESIDEARARADESLSAMLLQKRNFDKITNKMKTQGLLLKNLQSVVAAYKKSSSKLTKVIQDQLQYEVEMLNQNFTDQFQKNIKTYRLQMAEEISDIESQSIETKIEMGKMRNTMRVKSQEMVENYDRMERRLDEMLPRILYDVSRNNSRITGRIETQAQKIAWMTSRVSSIEEDANNRKRALEITVRQNGRMLNHLENLLRDLERKTWREISKLHNSFEDPVFYLNSTFHHLRAVVMRQANRSVEMSTMLYRIISEGKRTKDRISGSCSYISKIRYPKYFGDMQNFFNLRKHFEERVTMASNKTVTLKSFTMTELELLRKSLEAALSHGQARLFFFNDTLSHLTKRQEAIYSSVTAIERRGNLELEQRIGDLSTDMTELHSSFTRLQEESRNNISSINRSLQISVQKKLNKIDAETDLIKDGIKDFELRVSELAANYSKSTNQLASYRRFLLRINRHLFHVRHVSERAGHRTSVTERKIKSVNSSLEAVATKLSLITSRLRDHDDVMRTNRYEISSAKSKLMEETRSIHRFYNLTQQLVDNVKLRVNGTNRKLRHQLSHMDRRLDGIIEQLQRLRVQSSAERRTANEIKNDVEDLNRTLGREIMNCFNNISVVDDAIDSLRHSDVTIAESIQIHDLALLEHRSLHRNLTDLSQGVYSMISQHSETLDTVQQVVVKLNETVEEGKEQIEETLSAQMLRHMRELRGLQSLMRNFTTLIQDVLNDKLNQEISLASIRLRQHSIFESIDDHSVSIARLKTDSNAMKSSMVKTEQMAGSLDRRLLRTIRILDSHQRQLRDFDAITFRLTDVMSQLNISLFTQNDEINELDRSLESNRDFIYDIAGILSNHQELLSNHKQSMKHAIDVIMTQQAKFYLENNRYNVTLTSLTLWSNQISETVDDVQTSIEMMDTRIGLLAGALDSLAFAESNITDIRWLLDDVTMQTDQNTETNKLLQKSILETGRGLDHLRFEFDSTVELNQERHATSSRDIRLLTDSLTITAAERKSLLLRVDLIENRTLSFLNDAWVRTNSTLREHEDALLSISHDDLRRVREMRRMEEEITKHSSKLNKLSISNQEVAGGLVSLRTTTNHHTTAISLVIESLEEAEGTVKTMQDNLWSANTRLSELTSRSGDLEEQISLIEVKLRRSQAFFELFSRDFGNKIEKLESNVTDIANVMEYLEYDVDHIYDVTDELDHSMKIENTKIEILNQSFNTMDRYEDVLARLVSIEKLIAKVNRSLALDVTEITSLLVDFQLAFDTSGRVMEKQGHDLNILAANTTNYFDFFIRTIDFLKEIVLQTSEAVRECRVRVQHLNETVLFLELSSAASSNKSKSIAVNNSAAASSLPHGGSKAHYYPEQDNLEEDYYEDYDEYESHRTKTSFSPMPGNRERSDYDVDAVLTGEADQIRIERKKAELQNGTYEEEYYDYDGDDY